MLDFIIFAVTVALTLIIAIIYLYPGSKRSTTIPGPDISDPLEGNLPDIVASGSLHEFLVDLHATYGKIVSFWYGPQMCVSIASPELFKQHANIFDRPPILFELFEPLITPSSIQYANGAEARKRLNAYSKSFTHEAIREYMDIFIKRAVKVKKKWLHLAKEEHIPLTENMFCFAAETMLEASFGRHFENEKEILKFTKAYEWIWSEMESRLGGEKVDDKREELFEKHKTVIYDLLLKAMETAKTTPPAEGGSKQFVHTLLDPSLGLSQEVRKADMVSLAIGGIHTTGYLLTWSIYFMATHPEVQKKVYDELVDVLGEETIVFEAVPQLRYLRQVLDESLRCSILAPMAARYQDIDSELGGHKIPSGTPVVHALGVVSQDEDLWPEPEKFDPDRFSEENRKDIPSFGFEPFGFAGKRKCVGYRFSYFEATVLLSEILRKFQVELVEGQVVQKVHGLVTRPADEIWIKLKKRN